MKRKFNFINYSLLLYFLFSCFQGCSLFKQDSETSSTFSTSFFDKKILVAPISETKFNLTPLIKTLLNDNKINSDETSMYDIKGHYQNKPFFVNGALKVKNGNINVIALKDGQKIFNINLDSDLNFKTLTSISQIKENPQDIILDICLIYLSHEDLKDHLPSVFKIEESENERNIYYEEMPIMQIVYDSKNRLIANVEVNNVLKNYAYRLTRIN